MRLECLFFKYLMESPVKTSGTGLSCVFGKIFETFNDYASIPVQDFFLIPFWLSFMFCIGICPFLSRFSKLLNKVIPKILLSCMLIAFSFMLLFKFFPLVNCWDSLSFPPPSPPFLLVLPELSLQRTPLTMLITFILFFFYILILCFCLYYFLFIFVKILFILRERMSRGGVG